MIKRAYVTIEVTPMHMLSQFMTPLDRGPEKFCTTDWMCCETMSLSTVLGGTCAIAASATGEHSHVTTGVNSPAIKDNLGFD